MADELTARQVPLNLGGSVYHPNDAVGGRLFGVPAMDAEFETDLGDRAMSQRGVRDDRGGLLRGVPDSRQFVRLRLEQGPELPVPRRDGLHSAARATMPDR